MDEICLEILRKIKNNNFKEPKDDKELECVEELKRDGYIYIQEKIVFENQVEICNYALTAKGINTP